MVFWNQRMALLTGDARYVDVLERALYNGALDGLSLAGDRFFYANPLASLGSSVPEQRAGRKEWFSTACCPPNIARLVASVGGYIYAVSDRRLWVNLFVSSRTHVKSGTTDLEVRVETRYPWDGTVKVILAPAVPTRHTLYLRIPGWARGTAVPGDLYQFVGTDEEAVRLNVNGRPAKFDAENGYAVLSRTWKPGDQVELVLPMPIRKLIARDAVHANSSRVALQRGPLVYCVEGADNAANAWDFIVPQDLQLTAFDFSVLDEQVVALRANATALVPTPDGSSVQVAPKTLTAIPYYTWANRSNYDMQVWLPTRIAAVKIGA
jgi:DUF1680 family protein